jgi:hypothetical protein
LTTFCSRILLCCAVVVVACLAGPAFASAAPDTRIDSSPTAPSTDGTARFTFSSPDVADATFECRHHPAGQEPAPDFATCAPPVTLSGLTDGVYTFAVRAVDATGPDETPAAHDFTVDTTAPDTTIASGPPALSNDPTPEFVFTGTEAGSFECRHHRAGEAAPAFAQCESPYAPGALADGDYVFEVMAVDLSGNRQPVPDGHFFSIDTTPPQAEITGGPGDTTAAAAVFLFSASGATSLSCRLDGGAWQPCQSPQTYSGLSLGGHNFEVTAVDAAGNADPTPAHHAWQVLKPGLLIPAAVKQATALARELVQIRRALSKLRLRALARRRTVLFRSFDALTAGTVEVSARARVRRGGKRRWVGALKGEREVSHAGRHRIRATVTKKGRRVARSRQRLLLELRLSFTDLAGRSLWATSELTLKR